MDRIAFIKCAECAIKSYTIRTFDNVNQKKKTHFKYATLNANTKKEMKERNRKTYSIQFMDSNEVNEM